MQLPKINNQLKPLTLATIGIMATTSIFAYSDVDSYSNVINSKKTIQYFQDIDYRESYQFTARSYFQFHLQSWQEQTMFYSSVADIVNNLHFQAIVAMGEQAVPFIKEELLEKPSTLVWALNYIYGKKISNNPNLTISEACKLWIKEI